ncbi:MAG TPA: autorepressor SdpR family transcription factor [Thermoanaerobaculia bacterium]|jgi:ArsR family transcriptional regulator, arsenate/arsenite/antimonite-responsive transcriptional repressor|nr:autorepressor SdpR family transcription factor [Thermoanaerobaculia bacterium]
MDRTFRALADPTRRRILALLRDGDLPAGAIAERFDMAWPSVSHHLGILKEAGLVQAVREGQQIRYSLDTTVLEDVLAHLIDLSGRRRPRPGKKG